MPVYLPVRAVSGLKPVIQPSGKEFVIRNRLFVFSKYGLFKIFHMYKRININIMTQLISVESSSSCTARAYRKCTVACTGSTAQE